MLDESIDSLLTNNRYKWLKRFYLDFVDVHFLEFRLELLDPDLHSIDLQGHNQTTAA